jgi:hypothetical protein
MGHMFRGDTVDSVTSGDGDGCSVFSDRRNLMIVLCRVSDARSSLWYFRLFDINGKAI